jgi:hypothetical protein
LVTPAGALHPGAALIVSVLYRRVALGEDSREFIALNAATACADYKSAIQQSATLRYEV